MHLSTAIRLACRYQATYSALSFSPWSPRDVCRCPLCQLRYSWDQSCIYCIGCLAELLRVPYIVCTCAVAGSNLPHQGSDLHRLSTLAGPSRMHHNPDKSEIMELFQATGDSIVCRERAACIIHSTTSMMTTVQNNQTFLALHPLDPSSPGLVVLFCQLLASSAHLNAV